MPRKGSFRPRPPVGDVRDPDSLYHHLLRYLAHLAEKNYSPRTIEIRDKYLRYLIAWCDERSLTQPRQIGRPILERYQRHLFYYRKRNGEPLSTRSQHARIIPIRHWFRWLVAGGPGAGGARGGGRRMKGRMIVQGIPVDPELP